MSRVAIAFALGFVVSHLLRRVLISAHFCPICETRWPSSSAFDICPECDTRTTYRTKGKPISMGKAKKRKAQADFNRFYADREMERRHAGEPSPEQVGAQEAQEIMALERVIAA